MSDTGDLTLLDGVESPIGRPLFHPSGRFVYVNVTAAGGALTVYSIDPQGRLGRIQLVVAGTAMAVTLPVGGEAAHH
jgi:hypothetical protein